MSSPARTGRGIAVGSERGKPPIPLRTWIIAGLGLLAIAGASTFARRSVPPDGSTDGDDPPRIIHVHRSDLRGNDASGALRIRCRFCAGGGKTWHWAEVRQNGHIIRSYKDGVIPCPACDGSGVNSTRSLRDDVRVVPDDQPADYNEKRLVRSPHGR